MLYVQAAEMRKERAKSLIVLSEKAIPASKICGGGVVGGWLLWILLPSLLLWERCLLSSVVALSDDFFRGDGGGK